MRARFPWPRTLRARLLLTLVTLLAAVGCLIGAVTTLALRQQLVGQVDERLRMSASVAVRGDPRGEPGGRGRGEGPPSGAEPLCGEGGAADPLRGPDRSFGALTACFAGGVLVPGASGIVDPSTADYTRPLGAQDAASLAEVVRAAESPGTGPPAAAPRTVSLADGTRYRVVALPGDDGVTAVLGLPLTETRGTLARIVAVEAVVVVSCVALAAAAGSLLIRRELRPLQRVAATAARVSELPLHSGEVALAERVPTTGTDPTTEVGQVGAALNRLLDHVGAALNARHASEQRLRRFIADASHELRTPLAGIRGYAELTRRRTPAAEPVPDDVAHALRRVEAEALRMSGLVEDLLLLARLDAGRPLAREDVDLTMLLLDAVSDARAAGPSHRWRLDLTEDVITACGDPARLHQVLANLLANARTHTPPGSTVTTRLAREGGRVVLEVADDGPGVDPAVLPHVFDRFARADTSRSRAAGSTGLGLAIVDAVVTAHGGSVTVSTVPGRTVFRVELPVAT